jgi:4-amino-4-deoxy-L-arabinose transferase-like glycosyltransferase
MPVNPVHPAKQTEGEVTTPLKSRPLTENSSERLERPSLQVWVRIAFLCIAVVFGFIQAWDSRNVMNTDGIAYLDMADAYSRGGWIGLVNPHWSPLYPWILSLALFLVKPSPYWEFAIVHLVNFLIYLFTLLAFDYLLRELIANQKKNEEPNPPAAFPAWALMATAYLVFLWSSLSLITLWKKSPDMLMASFVYVATAIVLRIRRGNANWRMFVCLGTVLGLGYLAKAPMFPLAFVFLGTVLFVPGNLRKTVPLALAALSVFVIVSGPFIFALSSMQGRFTFGDSAKLNYLWNINKVGPEWYVQDLGTARGKFQHPPLRIFDFPPVYDFTGPVGGSQPSWYDPSYWMEGAVPHFDAQRQLAALRRSAEVYSRILFIEQAGFLAVFLTLFLVGGPKESLRGIAQQWSMLVPVLAALAMYFPVLVERRYVAVFLAILWVALFFGLRLPATKEFRKLAWVATFTLLITVGTPLALSAAHDLLEIRHRPHPHWEVAQGLRQMGIRPGDVVGRVGGTLPADWARLLRVRVIAEIPRDKAEDFWSSGPVVQAGVIESFSKTGATAIVAQQIPPYEVFVPTPGWERIGNGNFYVFILHRDPKTIGLTSTKQ